MFRSALLISTLLAVLAANRVSGDDQILRVTDGGSIVASALHWDSELHDSPEPRPRFGIDGAVNGDYRGPVSVSGWLAQGITYNPSDPINRENFPVAFNDRANEYQLNQLYFSLKRSVSADDCAWDVGGQADILLGSDYYYTTSIGLETHRNGSQRWNRSEGARGAGIAAAPLHGISLPQLYVEIHAPLLGGMNIKVGHFLAPFGYERIEATKNFFYSQSYARRYAMPSTLTGGTSSHKLANGLSFLWGASTGWNNWGSHHGQWGLLAGVGWESSDKNTAVEWIVHSGDDGPPGANAPSVFFGTPDADNLTLSSLVLFRRLANNITYVLQHDFGRQKNGSLVGGRSRSAKWYGINQYLTCDFDECWSGALRLEWFRDQDHSRVLGLPTSGLVSGGNYFALSVGLNWMPRRSLTVRPELRYDWSDAQAPLLGIAGPFDFFSKDDQLTLGLDVIFVF